LRSSTLRINLGTGQDGDDDDKVGGMMEGIDTGNVLHYKNNILMQLEKCDMEEEGEGNQKVNSEKWQPQA
jgi:hypothetical protein